MSKKPKKEFTVISQGPVTIIEEDFLGGDVPAARFVPRPMEFEMTVRMTGGHYLMVTGVPMEAAGKRFRCVEIREPREDL